MRITHLVLGTSAEPRWFMLDVESGKRRGFRRELSDL